MRKPDGQTLFLGAILFAAVAVGGLMAAMTFLAPAEKGLSADSSDEFVSLFKPGEIPFNGERAYQWLKDICAIGPRPSGSEGMKKQQKLLTDHFEKLGAKVTLQTFTMRHPVEGKHIEGGNLIVEFFPERKERILFCAHYDTRPFPDRDPDRRKQTSGTFIGANDGASGAALLCEMGTHIAGLDTTLGVDFVLFDAEEFVFQEKRDPYFLGSKYFAQQYVLHPPGYKYRWGILLDMIADKELQIYREVNSMSWPDVRPLTESIWATAKRLGVKEFIHRTQHTVLDDHVPLHDEGKIPVCDLIDFDYPRPGAWTKKYWHTEADTPDKCSAQSLAKVGWVLVEWLKTQK